jgi:hypothetical protein
LNGTHQPSAYADDINIVVENIHTTKKNIEALLKASKKVGPEVNPEKTKYILMSHSQKHSINKANILFEDVAMFKYTGTILTDQNCMHEELNSRLYSGNASYHSVQGLLSSRLLSTIIKVKIYKSRIWPIVLYGCGTWSLNIKGGAQTEAV